jgi:hypothetical protein
MFIQEALVGVNVQMKARMTLQPATNLLVFVRH